MSREHADLLSIHKARYIQSDDPGAVGAGKEWLDISEGGKPIRRYRNDDNDGWEDAPTEWVTGSSLGTEPDGAAVFAGRDTDDFQFRRIKAGNAYVSVLETGSNVQIFGPAPGGGASALDDLTDVVIDTPTAGQVLKYDGDNWINDTDAGGGGGATILDELDDVAIVDVTEGDILKYDSGFWVNQPVAAPDIFYKSNDTFTVADTMDDFSLIDNDGTVTGLGSVTIPADFWEVGKVVKFRAIGQYTFGDATASTIEYFMLLGATQLATIQQNDLPNTMTFPQQWEIDAEIVCLATGASGSIAFRFNGKWFSGFANSASQWQAYPDDSPSPLTIDLTADLDFDFRLAMIGFVSADNEITVQSSSLLEGGIPAGSTTIGAATSPGLPTTTRYDVENEAASPDANDRPFRSVGTLPGDYTALGADTLTTSSIVGNTLVITDPSGAINSNLTRPVSGDFTFTILVGWDETNTNYGGLGLMIRGTNFQYRFGYQWADGFLVNVARWDDNDTFGANIGSIGLQFASERYFRVVVTGTAASFQTSLTGLNWKDIIVVPDFSADIPEGIQAAGVAWNGPVTGAVKFARFDWDPADSVGTPLLVTD